MEAIRQCCAPYLYCIEGRCSEGRESIKALARQKAFKETFKGRVAVIDPADIETNAHVVERIMRSSGGEEVSGFTFHLPSGEKVVVRSADDPFLNEPCHATMVTAFTSAEAAAPVKMRGDYWRVHQNDPDDIWPSDFHAHNWVRPETMDCYTGNIYDARTKQWKRRYRPKQLAAFLDALSKRVIRVE